MNGDRKTLPPGADSDPIEDPEHRKIVTRLEMAMDARFQQIAEHFAHELRKQLRPVVNDVADHHETKRRLDVLQADVEAVKARCPMCSMPPPRGGNSAPPGE